MILAGKQTGPQVGVPSHLPSSGLGAGVNFSPASVTVVTVEPAQCCFCLSEDRGVQAPTAWQGNEVGREVGGWEVLTCLSSVLAVWWDCGNSERKPYPSSSPLAISRSPDFIYICLGVVCSLVLAMGVPAPIFLALNDVSPPSVRGF